MRRAIELYFQCPCCGRGWLEHAWGPEAWDGHARVCPWPDCGGVGLTVAEVPRDWRPLLSNDGRNDTWDIGE